MNRDTADWPAVRAAVNARMDELGLSAAEVAGRMNMSEKTLEGFLAERTRPHWRTVRYLNDALGLPYDHLCSIAQKRPRRPDTARPAATGEGTPPVAGPAQAATLLSLTDLAPGAQMVAEYRAYVLMVANEIAEGLTREQRSTTGRFLSSLADAVQYGHVY